MALAPFDLKKYKVSQKFGIKDSAYRLGFHPGTDYKMPSGTAVGASLDGYATWHWSKSYGWVASLIIKNGDVLWFAHNSRKGKTGNVKKGDVIAYSGNTGWSTGPHSHVEYRVKGSQDNVKDFDKWLKANPEPKPKPKFNMPKVGQSIVLSKGVNRTTYRKGTTTRAGTIRPIDSSTWIYKVRGYDSKYPNRIIINSKSAGGNGIALALYYTNGKRIEGWKIK